MCQLAIANVPLPQGSEKPCIIFRLSLNWRFNKKFKLQTINVVVLTLLLCGSLTINFFSTGGYIQQIVSLNDVISKLISHPYRVVLWVIDIPNLKEFFLYVPWEFMGLSFKLTNGRTSFTQSANSNTLSETLSGCDWLIVCNQHSHWST